MKLENYTEKHTVLIVDDEQNILKSLSRLFEDEEYNVLTALSGSEGLEEIKSNNISLIISDSRMPQMSGIDFLEKASKISPDTVRVMMTGFTDIDGVIDAINKGQVYRYIEKPWKDEEIKILVTDGIKHYELLEQNKYLTQLTMKQNTELKDLNKNLEKKVEERARIIIEKNIKLEQIFEVLDKSFVETIRIILKVLEIKDEKLGAHAKRVTSLAVLIAKDMKLSEEEIRDIEIAALLHDIGKVNMPSFILFKKNDLLTIDQRVILKQHPIIGNLTLAAIDRLKNAAEIVLSHHERIDGSGYPYKKFGDDIVTGAKIIAVADTFDKLTSGSIQGIHPIEFEEALEDIESKKGSSFDENVVMSFSKVIKNVKNVTKKRKKREVDIKELHEGMILSANISTKSGIVLMRKNDIINEVMISKIKQYVEIEDLLDPITVFEK